MSLGTCNTWSFKKHTKGEVARYTWTSDYQLGFGAPWGAV